jgi:glucose/arabinose dehydrogenase
MTTERKCPSCASTKLEPGAIHSTGRIYFRPENTKFLTLGTSDVPLTANLCMDCGNVMLVGDLHKANKLVGKAKTALNTKQDGTAEGSQPIRSETNTTSSAAGSRH